MNEIIVIIISSFIAVIAWLSRFAIKEYPVFKRFKIPSQIFKYGGFYIFVFLIWNISAHNIYSKTFDYIPKDKISKVNESIGFLMADKSTIYFAVCSWLFLWFCLVIIDEIAKSIHKAREQEKQ